MEVSVVDFIPFGRDKAIKREDLLELCRKNGIAKSDRVLRHLIQKERRDYVILNLSDGNGYYRPTHDDLHDLQAYIRQERKRAIETFKNIKMAKKLYEDFVVGRLSNG